MSKTKVKMAEASTRKADPKFKVIPNLSLKGADLLKRLKNRSLILDNSGSSYSIDAEVDAARRMDKVEILNTMKKNQMTINQLNEKLSR